MMLADGLYKRFPKPDYCLALRGCAAEAGHIHYTEGLAMANVDTVEIVVKGGAGTAPRATTVDPIVIAAKLILDLQTIVGREMNPTDPGVVTVGSIHAGTKANIIPNEAKLQITVRSTKDSTRGLILEAIERKAKAAAESADAPMPEVTVVNDEFTPKLENHPELTRKTISLFKQVLGADKIHAADHHGRRGFLALRPQRRDSDFHVLLGFGFSGSRGGVETRRRQAAAWGTYRWVLPNSRQDDRDGSKTLSLAVLNLVGK